MCSSDKEYDSWLDKYDLPARLCGWLMDRYFSKHGNVQLGSGLAVALALTVLYYYLWGTIVVTLVATIVFLLQ